MTVTAAPPDTGADKGLRGVARGGVANLAGTAFTGVAGLGVTWLVAHALDGRTAHAGAFFAATAAFVLAGAVAKLGTQTSLVYWPARLRAQGAVHLLGPCLVAGLVPVGVAATALAAGLWLAASRLAAAAAGGDPAFFATQLRLLALFLPAAALSDALLAATRGYRAMRPTVLVDRVVRPALQLLALGVAALSAPGTAFAVAWAAPYVVSALLAARTLTTLHSGQPRGAPARGGPAVVGAALLVGAAPAVGGPAVVGAAPAVGGPAVVGAAPAVGGPAVVGAAPALGGGARGIAGPFWRFSAPRALAGVAQLALQRVDILLVAGLAGLRAAAVYTVAGRFVVLGQFVNQAVSQAVQPRLAERLAVDDRAGTRELYRYATAWLVLVTWPLYLLVAAYASVYLGLFGAGYRTGTTIVVTLAAAMLVATGCGMVDMVLAMAGRTSWNLANVVLALAVTCGVDLALIPRLGAFGAALGLAAAVCVNNLLPLAQIGLALKLHPFGRATFAAAALAVCCFGVPALVLRTAVGDRPAALAIGGAVVATAGAAGYLVAVHRLRRLFGLHFATPGRNRRP